MKIKKYEISKMLLAIIFGGIFVVALVALVFLYMGQVQEKEDLEEELALVKNKIIVLKSDIGASESTKEELALQIDDIKADSNVIIVNNLTTSLDTSDIFNDMLGIAGAVNVDLTIIGESKINGESIAGVSYQLRTIKFHVEGKATDIYDFVDELSEELHTSILNSVKLTKDNSKPHEVTSADMQLKIYSY